MRSGTDQGPAGEGGAGPGLERLVRDGLLTRTGPGYRTTVRWQGAMARAALHLWREDEGGRGELDLRVPIAVALVSLYRDALTDQEIATLVVALLPIEAAELDPRAHLAAPPPHPG